ncbi:hypothetical protein F4782DRAFT_509177 [Xylaria castorea]|nr:hypothetical protein F4782DRAFT_509177 [Xylaria castorea]
MTLASLVVAWAVATLILGLVYGIPVTSLYDDLIPYDHSLPIGAAQLFMISVHIGIEILILFLPIPSVLRLQASPEKKRLIILTFVVGGAGCIVSIARIPVSLLSGGADFSWQLVSPALLAATELTVGFLAVSFPVYRPLFKKPAHDNNSNRRLVDIDDCPGVRRDGFSPSKHEIAVSAVQDISTRHNGIMVTDEIELMRRPKIVGGRMKVPDEAGPKP